MSTLSPRAADAVIGLELSRFAGEARKDGRASVEAGHARSLAALEAKQAAEAAAHAQAEFQAVLKAGRAVISAVSAGLDVAPAVEEAAAAEELRGALEAQIGALPDEALPEIRALLDADDERASALATGLAHGARGGEPSAADVAVAREVLEARTAGVDASAVELKPGLSAWDRLTSQGPLTAESVVERSLELLEEQAWKGLAVAVDAAGARASGAAEVAGEVQGAAAAERAGADEDRRLVALARAVLLER